MIILASYKKGRGKRISIIIISVLLAFCLVSMTVTVVVYDSIFARYDTAANIPAELTPLVQTRQVCQFPSGDNQLTGYYYGATAAAHGLIVFVPGFHAGGDHYLPQIQWLTENGWGVFTFDTTGTYQSQGKSQVGFSQVLFDLDAALKHVEKSDRFGYNELVLMGHSRGGYAVCCALAQTRDVAAVVSISGVNSPMEAVMERSKDAVGVISYGNYGFLWLYQTMLFGKDTLQTQASEVLSQTQTPVLVIHGKADEDIPQHSGAIIAYQDEISSHQVQYLLADGGHTDLLYDADGSANDALMEQIHGFLLDNLG